MSGRPKKPTIVKLLQSTVRPCRELPDSVEISGELSEIPGWLTDEQRQAWQLAISSVPPGMLKDVDAPALVTWVLAQSAQREAALAWQAEGLSVEDERGKRIVNPSFASFKSASELILRSAAELGFTPVSRSKVKVADKAKPEAGFGKFREARAG